MPQLPKILEKSLSKSTLVWEALYKRPESLSALLPYDEFMSEQKLFRHKDGSLGAIFEIELVEHEPLTGSQIVETVQSLKPWLNLPENCVVQVIYDQAAISPRDQRFLQFKNRYSDGHPVSNLLFNAKVEGLLASCQSDSEFRPIERKGYLAIRYFPNQVKHPRVIRSLRRGEKILFDEMQGYLKEIKAFQHILENILYSSKIVRLKMINADELLNLLRRFFNPLTYFKRDFSNFNPNVPISDQVVFCSPTLDHAGIERESIRSRTITLKTSPLRSYPGGPAYFTKLSFPFRIAITFSFPSAQKIKKFLDVKEFFLQNTPSARARRQREEIQEVQTQLAHDDKCLHMTFAVTVEGKDDEELDRRTREIVSVFNNDLETEVTSENDIGCGLVLASLPLNYTPHVEHSAQRHIRILRSDAIRFLPVFDSFRGLKRPVQLYQSRENNIVPFSLTENESSNHSVVVGSTGSGKSVLVIDLVQSFRRQHKDSLIFVIDKKSSYLAMSEYFDADLTIFDRNNDMPFTPFRGVFDEEKIGFLTQLLINAIQLTSPNFSIESEHRAAIAKALRLAYLKNSRNQGLSYVEGSLVTRPTDELIEVTMDDFMGELGSLTSDPEFETMSKPIEDVINKLRPFYGTGDYARFFRGSKVKKNQKSGFYIFDLDSLDSDPTLQVLMTMAVFEEVRQIIRRPENKGKPGLLVIEEIGQIGKNPTAAKFIIDAAMTYRKLGIWMLGLSPYVEDYFTLPPAKAMWNLSDNLFFLQLGDEQVELLKKNSALIDEANSQIIKSLRTVRGQYSDVFYTNKSKTRSGAFRSIPSPFHYWLSPTNSRDALEMSRAFERFKNDKWKALEYLAATYPNGVPAES